MTVNPPEKKKSKRQQTLAQIVLNNAQAHTHRRSAEVEPAIKKICDAARRDENLLLGDGVTSARIDRGPGFAVFSFSVGDVLVSACHTCWSASISDKAWEVADKMFHRLVESNGAPDLGYQFEDAPAVPWLSTILLPDRAKLSKKHQRTIEALEPLFAWASSDIEESNLGEVV